MDERFAPQPVEKINFKSVLTLQEAEARAGELPFHAAVEVFDASNQEFFQPLEQPDGEGVGLKEYRTREVSQIMGLLENNRVVALVAPSRSGKTEAVLHGGDRSFFPDTLEARTQGCWLDVSQFDDIQQMQKGLLDEKAKKGDAVRKIALIDEFKPNEEGGKFVRELLEKDYQVVICFGGRRSNQTKIESLRGFAARIQLDIPVVEMGLKPLNQVQLRELFEISLADEKNNKQKETEIGKIGDIEEQQIREAANLTIGMCEELPLVFYPAESLFSEIIAKRGKFDLSGESVLAVEHQEDWQRELKYYIKERSFTHIKLFEVLSPYEKDLLLLGKNSTTVAMVSFLEGLIISGQEHESVGVTTMIEQLAKAVRQGEIQETLCVANSPLIGGEVNDDGIYTDLSEAGSFLLHKELQLRQKTISACFPGEEAWAIDEGMSNDIARSLGTRTGGGIAARVFQTAIPGLKVAQVYNPQDNFVQELLVFKAENVKNIFREILSRSWKKKSPKEEIPVFPDNIKPPWKQTWTPPGISRN